LEGALAELDEVRQRTLALVGHLERSALERRHHPLQSPPVWDLAHIAAFEDLWLCHRYGGLPLLRPDLASLYDAFATPRAVREVKELGLLGTEETFGYMAAVRERTASVLRTKGPGDGKLLELVLRHELQHTETLRQTLAAGGLLPAGEPSQLTVDKRPGEVYWVELAGGSFLLGAADHSFAYDNERPAHQVAVGPFAIALHPLQQGDWELFVADGGYRRRELWSEEGWNWLGSQPNHQLPPPKRGKERDVLLHVNRFEAEALARYFGGRLPTEVEWEFAARQGVLEGRGLAWEWTASEFGPYPGFRADPYPEYSTPFFAAGYYVLRGGSWATDRRVATTTFRNWDLPDRNQIFAGVRPAKDLELADG
jgi:iron(II)-dependent oxidoreductase